MKKSLILALALVLLLSAGTAFVQNRLIGSLKNPSFEMETISGDPSAADGITITETDYMGEHLYWENSYSIKEGQLVSSSAQSFESKARRRDGGYPPLRMGGGSPYRGGVWIQGYLDLDYDYSSYSQQNRPEAGAPYPDTLDPYNKAKGGLSRAFNDLYESTAPGEEGIALIRLADYMDYYPLTVSVELPGRELDDNGNRRGDIYYGFSPDFYTMDERSSLESYVILKLMEHFRIPVLEDQYVQIQLYRPNNGTGTSHAQTSGTMFEEKGGDGFSLYTNSFATDDGIYFWFNNRTFKGELIDTSHIPEGYGIYLLPVGNFDFRNTEGEIIHVEKGVDVDSFRLFYPVNEEDEIRSIWVDPDGERLLLHRISEGRYLVDVIDTKRGEKLQEIEVATEDEYLSFYDGGGRYYNIQEEAREEFELVWIGGKRLVAITEVSEGCYGISVDCQLTQAQQEDTDLKRIDSVPAKVMLWDGERLVIACIRMSWQSDERGVSWYNYGCGPGIYVFSGSRLEFQGRINSSLELVNPAQYYSSNNTFVMPFGYLPLTIKGE
jgi:hypothetical protein